MSLLVADKTVVSIHYTLTDPEGNTLDSSAGADPLVYLHGAGNIIPGLEKELSGQAEGNSLEVTVAPAEGYGEHEPGLVQVLPRSAFQGVDNVEPGMAFQAQGPEGQVRRIVVTGVDGDNVTVDGNHPLAGVELNFAVEVVAVREATDEEIAHGHAH